MSSLWEPAGNGSCYSPTQSAFLKDVQFGGVPVVLLLDFVLFLVCVCVCLS